MKRKPTVFSFTFLTSAAVWVVLGIRVGVLSLILGGEVHGQAIPYVHAIANAPTLNGSSWWNAYLQPPPALSAASAVATIHVAYGEFHAYHVGFPSPAQATFQLKNGVTLEGGYTWCCAPDPNARDTNPSATILTVDALGNDLEGNEFHDCCNSTCLPGCTDSSESRPSAWGKGSRETHI